MEIHATLVMHVWELLWNCIWPIPFVHLTPIPMLYMELLPHLLQKRLVAICPMKPMQPPFPKNYDPNAKCDYHGGGLVTLLRNVCPLNTRWKL